MSRVYSVEPAFCRSTSSCLVGLFNKAASLWACSTLSHVLSLCGGSSHALQVSSSSLTDADSSSMRMLEHWPKYCLHSTTCTFRHHKHTQFSVVDIYSLRASSEWRWLHAQLKYQGLASASGPIPYWHSNFHRRTFQSLLFQQGGSARIMMQQWIPASRSCHCLWLSGLSWCFQCAFQVQFQAGQALILWLLAKRLSTYRQAH